MRRTLILLAALTAIAAGVSTQATADPPRKCKAGDKSSKHCKPCPRGTVKQGDRCKPCKYGAKDRDHCNPPPCPRGAHDPDYCEPPPCPPGHARPGLLPAVPARLA